MKHRELMTHLCDLQGICVRRLVVEHVESRALLRNCNVHVSTGVATPKGKEAIAEKLCRIATSTHGSGIAHSTAARVTTATSSALIGHQDVDAGTLPAAISSCWGTLDLNRASARIVPPPSCTESTTATAVFELQKRNMICLLVSPLWQHPKRIRRDMTLPDRLYN